MKKIVILSFKLKPDEYLLELVQTLFPDCEYLALPLAWVKWSITVRPAPF